MGVPASADTLGADGARSDPAAGVPDGMIGALGDIAHRRDVRDARRCDAMTDDTLVLERHAEGVAGGAPRDAAVRRGEERADGDGDRFRERDAVLDRLRGYAGAAHGDLEAAVLRATRGAARKAEVRVQHVSDVGVREEDATQVVAHAIRNLPRSAPER